jgi:hypothetical protein
LILAWRRHLAALLYKKTIPAVEPSTEENKIEESIEEDDEIDKDIEEQLLKLNEQQRKEAKRLENEKKKSRIESNLNFF